MAFSTLSGFTTTGIKFYKTSSASSQENLVLVMGYAGGARSWPRGFVEKLAERYHVITLDNRGTGESVKPEDPSSYCISDMSLDLDSAVSGLGVGSFHLIGYSLGGCIALQYAGDFGSKVKTLVLMSTTGGGKLYHSPPREMLETLVNPQGATLWEVYLAVWKLCLSPQAIKAHETVLREILEATQRQLTPRFAMKGHLHAYRNFEGSAALKKLVMPVMILTGNDDRLTPKANSDALARELPMAKLVSLPDCEHMPHIEQREKVLSLLFEFCK